MAGMGVHQDPSLGRWNHLVEIKQNNLQSMVELLIITRCRPDTSRLPPCPLDIVLVPLKCPSRNLQLPHKVPFTKKKMHWCPFPFKNEAYSFSQLSMFPIKNGSSVDCHSKHPSPCGWVTLFVAASHSYV